MRIRTAFDRGYASGRWWNRIQIKPLPEDYYSMNPYSNYMPAVQCHIAWKIGYHLAFVNAGKSNTQVNTRRLYGV